MASNTSHSRLLYLALKLHIMFRAPFPMRYRPQHLNGFVRGKLAPQRKHGVAAAAPDYHEEYQEETAKRLIPRPA
jgi:hypothetical protein